MDQKTKPGLSLNMISNPGKGARGGDRPDVRGYVTLPGDLDRRFSAALYTNTYNDKKTGEERLYWKGKVDPFARTDSASDKFRANSARRAREQQAFRDGTPVADTTITLPTGGTLGEDEILIFEKADEFKGKASNGANKTDAYGYWNHQGKLVEIGGWIPETGFTTSIVGGTQYPLTNEQRLALGYKPVAQIGEAQPDDSFSPISDAELQAMARDAGERDAEGADLDDEPVAGFGEERKPGKRARSSR
jgi:hypothetical protein